MFCNFLFSQSDPVPIFGGAGIEERNAELQGCLGNKEARKIIFPAKPSSLPTPHCIVYFQPFFEKLDPLVEKHPTTPPTALLGFMVFIFGICFALYGRRNKKSNC